MPSVVQQRPIAERKRNGDQQDALVQRYLRGEITQEEFMASDPYSHHISAYAKKHAAERYRRYLTYLSNWGRHRARKH